MGDMLNITTEQKDGKLEVVLDGRLDTTSSPILEGRLKKEIGDTEELVFDMKELVYISSAGLRVLLSAQKVMNRQGSMKLQNVPENVMEIFDVTGFSDILTIEGQ